MEAAIFNCQCDQMQNCEGGCETVYYRDRFHLRSISAEFMRSSSWCFYCWARYWTSLAVLISFCPIARFVCRSAVCVRVAEVWFGYFPCFVRAFRNVLSLGFAAQLKSAGSFWWLLGCFFSVMSFRVNVVWKLDRSLIYAQNFWGSS